MGSEIDPGNIRALQANLRIEIVQPDPIPDDWILGEYEHDGLTYRYVHSNNQGWVAFLYKNGDQWHCCYQLPMPVIMKVFADLQRKSAKMADECCKDAPDGLQAHLVEAAASFLGHEVEEVKKQLGAANLAGIEALIKAICAAVTPLCAALNAAPAPEPEPPAPAAG